MLPRKNLVRNLKKAITQPGYAASTSLRRLRSYASYRFRDGHSAPPETISLFLTYKCNLACSMCGQWGDQGVFKSLGNEILRKQLTREKLDELIDEFATFKPNITLFGGEPMMYKDWTDVVARIKSRGMRCNMVTNGTLMSVYAERILDSGLDEIILSLDGTEEVHDETRCEVGTFSKLSEGVAEVARLRREKRERHPRLNINCTLFETNYKQLEEIVKVAEEIGADNLNFHHLLFVNKAAYDRHNEIFQENFGRTTPDWAGFVWDELPGMDPEALLDSIRRIRAMKSPVNVSVYPNFTEEEIRRYYTEFEFESTSYKNRCMSLWMTAYVMPDGEVRPYHTMNYSPGNVNAAPFLEIWNNPTYREYRRFIKKKKRFPVCSKGCTELYRY